MPLMREYPIIMSAPMVRAILEGRKTQTRRIASALWLNRLCRHLADGEGIRLWVRETWDLYHEDEDEGPERCVIRYRATEHDIVQLIPL